jgi:hypothetical protein
MVIEANGDKLRIDAPKGALTEELRTALAESKAEIMALLANSGITVGEGVGPCPHCQNPLRVISHPLDMEIIIECPTRPDLFRKWLMLTEEESAPSLCADCGLMPSLITGRCPECIQRLMLCPDELCGKCGGGRYWRHRANDSQPPGFRWRCAICDPAASRNVAWYELSY